MPSRTNQAAAALDLRDYVVRIDGGLPNELGERLIEIFGAESYLRPSLVRDGAYEPDLRQSNEVDMLKAAIRIGSPDARTAARKLKNCIHGWMDEYRNLVGSFVNLSVFTGAQLMRYGPGEFFATHTDARQGFERTVSAVALLPSTFTGGEFSFFDGEVPVDLAPGEVCLFPSSFLYPHSVAPVTSGVRWSVVSWLR